MTSDNLICTELFCLRVMTSCISLTILRDLLQPSLEGVDIQHHIHKSKLPKEGGNGPHCWLQYNQVQVPLLIQPGKGEKWLRYIRLAHIAGGPSKPGCFRMGLGHNFQPPNWVGPKNQARILKWVGLGFTSIGLDSVWTHNLNFQSLIPFLFGSLWS